MKTIMSRWLAAGIFAVGVPLAGAAQLEVDKAKTRIEVDAKATGHAFSGVLKDYKMTASGDVATMKPTALEVSWSFKDLDTADAKRDAEMLKWLGGGDPRGSYKFVKVWSQEGVDYAEGTLTLNGVSKTVHLPITMKKEGNEIRCEGKVGINYKDFGLPLIRAMLVMTVDPELVVRFTVVGKVK